MEQLGAVVITHLTVVWFNLLKKVNTKKVLFFSTVLCLERMTFKDLSLFEFKIRV